LLDRPALQARKSAPLRFENTVVLITGAGYGIGQAADETARFQK